MKTTISVIKADVGSIAGHVIVHAKQIELAKEILEDAKSCLLYTSPSPRDLSTSRMPSSA